MGDCLGSNDGYNSSQAEGSILQHSECSLGHWADNGTVDRWATCPALDLEVREFPF